MAKVVWTIARCGWDGWGVYRNGLLVESFKRNEKDKAIDLASRNAINVAPMTWEPVED